MCLNNITRIDEKLRGGAAQPTSSEPLQISQVLLLDAGEQFLLEEFIEEKFESAEWRRERAVDCVSLPESAYTLAPIQLE